LILNFTLAALPTWWAPPLTVILTAALALGCGWYVLHLWNREIILYERGFSYREGSQTVFFRYDEIASIRMSGARLAYFGGLIRRDAYRFTVTTHAGDTLAVTEIYRRVWLLGTTLIERVNQTLLPEIIARMEHGESVAFSAGLRLNAGSIEADGRALAWNSFGGFQIGGRRLILLDSTGAAWFALPLSEVDNLTLLLELLKKHGRGIA
jgi:hypothetical protein